MTDTALDLLQESGLFAFADDVSGADGVDSLIDRNQADRYGGLHPLVDHICIGAAEFVTVENGAMKDWGGYPVAISHRHLVMASLKYNCTLSNLCVPSAPQEGLILEQMSVFSADVARIWRILERHGGVEKLTKGPKELHSIIRELEQVYQRHPSEAARAYLQRRCVSVQGVLWRMQLTAASYPGFSGDLRWALRDSGEALDLPQGG